MQLLDNPETLIEIFKQFTKEPYYDHSSVYNALVKNDEPITGLFDDFQTHKSICTANRSVFKPGYDACTTKDMWFHTMHAEYDINTIRKHRIYINPASEHRLEFTRKLIKECLNNNIKFYFKFSRGEYRTDNIVIFASDEQLQQYSKVLQSIEVNYPQLVSKCGKTPLASTSVSWFSYGPEENSAQTGSLSTKTAKVIRKNITSSLINNPQLFSIEQLEKTNAIQDLYSSCVTKWSEDCKDATFKHNSHKDLEFAFAKSAKDIYTLALNQTITKEDIEQDKPIIFIGPQYLPITPSCISTMLAKQAPNFSSTQEKENFYNDFYKNCQSDLKAQNLDITVPPELKCLEKSIN